MYPFFIGEPCLVKLPHTHNIPPHTPSAWGSLIFLQRSRSGGGSLLFFLFLFFPVCMVWVRRGTLPINTIMGIVALTASSAGTVAITALGDSERPLLLTAMQHYSISVYYYSLFCCPLADLGSLAVLLTGRCFRLGSLCLNCKPPPSALV